MSYAPSLALSPLRRFYFEYGYFLEAYTAFETLIEILLGRELRLTNEETSITFASIGFGAKFSVLSALLARSRENEQKLRLLKEANKRAARNGFAHSFIIANKENQEFSLIRREVTNGYILNRHGSQCQQRGKRGIELRHSRQQRQPGGQRHLRHQYGQRRRGDLWRGEHGRRHRAARRYQQHDSQRHGRSWPGHRHERFDLRRLRPASTPARRATPSTASIRAAAARRSTA
jgi:hypothetical protein